MDTSDKVHDINTGRKKRVVGLALVSGSIIASCDEDGRIASWDAAAGKQVCQFFCVGLFLSLKSVNISK